jgi:hypothetical protein
VIAIIAFLPVLLLLLAVIGSFKFIKLAFDHGLTDKEKAGYVND